MLKGLVLPLSLGISTRFAGFGLYAFLLSLSTKSTKFSLRWIPYSSLVIPSIPTALSPSIFMWHSLRKFTSIRCPIDVNTILGFCEDSSAILANFVAICLPFFLPSLCTEKSTSVCSKCFLFDIVSQVRAVRTAPLDFPPPLILFTVSQVLFGPPTAYASFASFPFWLLGIPSWHT